MLLGVGPSGSDQDTHRISVLMSQTAESNSALARQQICCLPDRGLISLQSWGKRLLDVYQPLRLWPFVAPRH